jgi:hypothetical protein
MLIVFSSSFKYHLPVDPMDAFEGWLTKRWYVPILYMSVTAENIIEAYTIIFSFVLVGLESGYGRELIFSLALVWAYLWMHLHMYVCTRAYK